MIIIAIAKQKNYQQDSLLSLVDQLMTVCDYSISPGSVVLLKPNLVAAAKPNDLACTNANFVAAVASWCLEQGAKVRVGDSPAMVSGQKVMAICGYQESLQGLGVEVAPFVRMTEVLLPCGIRVKIAVDALECDYFINLPKVKCHAQVGLTLALKNYFGIVVGWRKAYAHLAYGGAKGHRFVEMILDLPQLISNKFNIVDGIMAMHRKGPTGGESFPLGLVFACADSYALDLAIAETLGHKRFYFAQRVGTNKFFPTPYCW